MVSSPAWGRGCRAPRALPTSTTAELGSQVHEWGASLAPPLHSGKMGLENTRAHTPSLCPPAGGALSFPARLAPPCAPRGHPSPQPPHSLPRRLRASPPASGAGRAGGSSQQAEG